MRTLEIYLNYFDFEFPVLIEEFPFHATCRLVESGIPRISGVVPVAQEEFPGGWQAAGGGGRTG